MVPRVLMVTRETAPDRRYGLGRSLLPVVEALAARGVQVRYLTRDELGERSLRWMRRLHRPLVRLLALRWPGTECESLAWGLLERFNMGRLAARVARREGYTHVHCHDPVIAGAFHRCAVGLKVAWGLTEHGFGSYTQAFHEDGARLSRRATAALRRWEARVLRRAHWVVCPTHASLAQLVRDLGLPEAPDHWRVIHHPLPHWELPPRHEARSRLGWDPCLRYVLAVGRLVPLKDFATLVRACARLHRADLRLCILGDGDTASLTDLADRLGFGAQLVLSRTDRIPDWYAAADVYASTSTTESFGLANLEAMASGLPMVCTAVGGVTEVLGDGAHLLAPGDPVVLAAALARMLDDPHWAASWAHAALVRGRRWPDAARVAQAYLALYRGEPATDWRAQPDGRPVPPVAPGEPQVITELPPGLRVLVLAPHPDDEVFGCGGTLLRLRARDAVIRVVVISDGARGDPDGQVQGDLAALRREETRTAMASIGIDDVHFLALPDGALAAQPALAARLEAELAEFAPDWVLAPDPADQHPDHRAVARALLAAWDSAAGRRLLCYEIWGGMAVNRLVDISAVVEDKRRLMRHYRIPHLYCDYTEAFTGLARYRGLGLDAPGGSAEAFRECAADTACKP